MPRGGAAHRVSAVCRGRQALGSRKKQPKALPRRPLRILMTSQMLDQMLDTAATAIQAFVKHRHEARDRAACERSPEASRVQYLCWKITAVLREHVGECVPRVAADLAAVKLCTTKGGGAITRPRQQCSVCTHSAAGFDSQAPSSDVSAAAASAAGDEQAGTC